MLSFWVLHVEEKKLRLLVGIPHKRGLEASESLFLAEVRSLYFF